MKELKIQLLSFSIGENMKYAIEDDGIYKVDVIHDAALKILVVPKDIVLEAAKRYNACDTDSLMDK